MSQKSDLWVKPFFGLSDHLFFSFPELDWIGVSVRHQNSPTTATAQEPTLVRHRLQLQVLVAGQIRLAVGAKWIEFFIPLYAKFVGIFRFRFECFKFRCNGLRFAPEVQDIWN